MQPPAFSERELRDCDAPGVHVERRSVRFHDVDAAGTLFYPRVLEYFSDTYVALLAARGVDVPAMLRIGSLAVPIVHAAASYVAPLRFGDAIDVSIAGVRVGRSSFTVGYRVERATDR